MNTTDSGADEQADWRDLLVRYIALVGASEGATFVEERHRAHLQRAFAVEFTDSEWETLIRANDEAWNLQYATKER